MACSFPFGAGGAFLGLVNATPQARQIACMYSKSLEAFPPGGTCFYSQQTKTVAVVYSAECSGCVPSTDTWFVVNFGYPTPVVHPTFVLSCNASAAEVADIQYTRDTTERATYALAVQDYNSEVFCRAECTRRKLCAGYSYTPSCLLHGEPGTDQVGSSLAAPVASPQAHSAPRCLWQPSPRTQGGLKLKTRALAPRRLPSTPTCLLRPGMR